MATVTREEKLADIKEARRCYEAAQKLIQQGDSLIRRGMSNVSICGHKECEIGEDAPYTDMIEVHLFRGILRFEKLLGIKAEPAITIFGEKDISRKVLCVNGIKFLQLGQPTQSKYNYR